MWSKSVVGQTLHTNSAPVPINVRCAPDSDQKYCDAEKAAKCQKRTPAPQQNASLFDQLVGARVSLKWEKAAMNRRRVVTAETRQ
jgi:hypothetical protein